MFTYFDVLMLLHSSHYQMHVNLNRNWRVLQEWVLKPGNKFLNIWFPRPEVNGVFLMGLQLDAWNKVWLT